jgi:hypothetical protein
MQKYMQNWLAFNTLAEVSAHHVRGLRLKWLRAELQSALIHARADISSGSGGA